MCFLDMLQGRIFKMKNKKFHSVFKQSKLVKSKTIHEEAITTKKPAPKEPQIKQKNGLKFQSYFTASTEMPWNHLLLCLQKIQICERPLEIINNMSHGGKASAKLIFGKEGGKRQWLWRRRSFLLLLGAPVERRGWLAYVDLLAVANPHWQIDSSTC